MNDDSPKRPGPQGKPGSNRHKRASDQPTGIEVPSQLAAGRKEPEDQATRAVTVDRTAHEAATRAVEARKPHVVRRKPPDPQARLATRAVPARPAPTPTRVVPNAGALDRSGATPEEPSGAAGTQPVALEQTRALDTGESTAPPDGGGAKADGAGSFGSPTANLTPSGPETPTSNLTPTGGLIKNEIEAGAKIAHYELIRELGRGGMAQVFLARDTRLGRLVAMKFIAAQSANLGKRFVAEARATAACNHENIVTIHEVDSIDSTPYMVLEYLEGKPLSKLIRRRRLPAGRAVELMVPVVRALGHAHELELVHRDLKPDNIFVTRSGQVKVLDFGIAKVLSSQGAAPEPRAATAMDPDTGEQQLTRYGTVVGTPAYMSPEQLNGEDIDHRTDLWAVGIILFRMLAARHPLDSVKLPALQDAAEALDEPMPSIRDFAPAVPEALADIVDRCLAKRPEDRWSTAGELLEALEALMPGRIGRALKSGESPYPGLTAFQESDADRFFGRGKDVAKAVARLRENPLLGVVGPSGVGKSSFVRAGVVPTLKSSGETWEVFTIRPGRDPLGVLSALIADATGLGVPAEVTQRLIGEPGLLGATLRQRARRKRTRILLFVDQFEELYTLVSDPVARKAFTASLAGAADDTRSPIRVITSMRSDLLDRLAEDPDFSERLMRGLVLLATPDRDGLREALTHPLEMVGYRLEDDSIAEDMLDVLESTSGALPLLQFAAAQLWEKRDRKSKMLTLDSYREIGGVAGALASHADEVLRGMASMRQKLVRAIFQRLVTTERTRAIVDIDELEGLSDERGEIAQVIDQLVGARLLVVQTGDDERASTVEIVHESLITSWPTLQRWLDDNQEDRIFLAQLSSVARQWDKRGRPQGLLWRGEAATEARRWRERSEAVLSGAEKDFLDEVVSLSTRSTRRRRVAVIAALVTLATIAAGAVVAVAFVVQAEQAQAEQADKAKAEARRAKEAEKSARAAEKRSRSAEAEVKRQLELLQEKERQRKEATERASKANQAVELSRAELKEANRLLRQKAEQAERERQKARKAAQDAKSAEAKARKAQARAEALYRKEKKRAEALQKQAKKIADKLR